jgi:hypothetical protein
MTSGAELTIAGTLIQGRRGRVSRAPERLCWFLVQTSLDLSRRPDLCVSSAASPSSSYLSLARAGGTIAGNECCRSADNCWVPAE